jgi:hypothetical protein
MEDHSADSLEEQIDRLAREVAARLERLLAAADAAGAAPDEAAA